MSTFTVESTYHLPVFRHRTYDVDNVADACRMAIEDDEWASGRFDHDSAGETYVTGIWEGVDAAYSGPAVPVPSHFEETIQRKAAQFEVLLGLLKMVVADAVAHRASPQAWIERASWAVNCGEAILSGARVPDAPAGLPKPSHALAWLEEDHVRDQITAILETDPDFEGLSRTDISDNDVHAACLTAASAADLSHEIGVVAFKAALAALGRAVARVRSP